MSTMTAYDYPVPPCSHDTICCQNGLDTTLGEFRDDVLYLSVLPIGKMIL